MVGFEEANHEIINIKSRNKVYDKNNSLLFTQKPKIATTEQSLTNSLSDKENQIDPKEYLSNSSLNFVATYFSNNILTS